MSFRLPHVFSRAHTDEKWALRDSKHISIALSKEAFYRYLFSKNDDQKLSVPQKLVVDVTLQTMRKKELRQKAVPRLPFIIPRLLKSLRDPDSAARDYVEIIDKDPVMASAVIKLANSVYFNPIGSRIHDIEQAVVKLGIDGLRSVLSAAVMQPIIQRESAYFSQSGQRIWQHSLCCAVACELIASHRQVDTFKVYILGLIHDIGKISLFSELCKQFKLNGENVAPGYSAFAPALKHTSSALSYWIAKDWSMPKDICEALAEQTTIEDTESLSVYGHILYQANLVSEIYKTIYPSKPNKARAVLEELDLPTDIYQTLDTLSEEL